MQLYTRTPQLSEGLIRITKFIIKVYVPSWFQIKSHSHFTADPSNLHLQMRLAVTSPVETRDQVLPVIQSNAYFSHPSIMISAMLASDDAALSKAATLLRGTRQNPPKPSKSRILKQVRKYQTPLLQWNADH